MGIVVTKPILVAQCGHCLHAEAMWTTEDGSLAPDLWFKAFPRDGRMVMTNQVLYLACRRCQIGLDEIVKDFTKTTDH